jgi:hypothetical protein
LESVFYQDLEKSTAHRKCRDDLKDLALQHTHFLEELFSIAFDVKNRIHYKACWVLELVLMEDLTLINSHMKKFLEVLPFYVHHGALRSISKIVMLLAYSKVMKIDDNQRETLIEMTFQWLSLSPKVATKAYSAYALNEFGKQKPDILIWVKKTTTLKLWFFYNRFKIKIYSFFSNISIIKVTLLPGGINSPDPLVPHAKLDGI